MQDILRQIQDVIFQENSEPQKVGDTRNTATQKNAINCGVLSVDNAGRNVIQAQDDNLKPNCKVILPASNPKVVLLFPLSHMNSG